MTVHLPPSDQQPATKRETKQDVIIGLLRRSNGATLDELMTATAWQAHSVRGFISATIKNRMRLSVLSERTASGERRYRLATSY